MAQGCVSRIISIGGKIISSQKFKIKHSEWFTVGTLSIEFTVWFYANNQIHLLY